VIAGVAVVVGLVLGVLQLIDRFAPIAPTPLPTAAPTPAPTTPSIRVDISSATGARTFIAFAEAASGQRVDIDLSCFETVPEPACILEGSDWELGDTEWLWLWVFTERPCFPPTLDMDPRLRDMGSCVGTNVFWIDPRVADTPVVLGNIQGAGTTAIKGPWDLTSPAGGAVLPPNIHGFRLVPGGRTEMPVAEPTG
jgi:hypothetical protein